MLFFFLSLRPEEDGRIAVGFPDFLVDNVTLGTDLEVVDDDDW